MLFEYNSIIKTWEHMSRMYSTIVKAFLKCLYNGLKLGEYHSFPNEKNIPIDGNQLIP